ncbi:MAG: tetratricopeptide repeat protein [Planctomycetota bacterium]
MTRIIAHRYEVEEVLHEGRLKAVYRVRDLRAAPRSLVLKQLVDMRPESRALVRFHNEFRVTSDLAHPAIPAVVGLGWEETPDRPFIVEEYAPGRSASRLGPRPEPAVLEQILLRVARALVYLHGRGIVHFDVKPDNLVVELDEDGRAVHRVKLLDFDLAGPPGPVGAGRGTMPFIAPEVRSGDETIDGRADLFSLGATMVALVLGEHPRELPLTADLDELRELLPEGTEARYGRSFLEIVHGLLRPHPDERISSARDLVALLAERDPSTPLETPDERLATVYRPRFVGRLDELARLRELMPESEPAGEGSARPIPFVLVSGERGVGKTRLLEQHVVTVQTSRRVVLRLESGPGRAENGSDALRELDSELRALLGDPPIEPGSLHEFADVADPRRFLLFSSITARLIRHARERAPACLVVDGLHTLGRLAREYVAYVLRRIGAEVMAAPEGLPLQVVMAIVSGRLENTELERLLDELREDGQLETLELAALTQDKSAQLLEAMTAPEAPTPAAADVLHERTHGNPLFLRETVASVIVQDDRVLAAEDAFTANRLESLPVATRVRGVVQSRVSRVRDTDLAILQLAALHPRRLDTAVLIRAGGLDEVAAREALERLSQRRLLETTSQDAPSFLDSDTREVVVEMMSQARREELHRRLAGVLRERETAEDAWTVAYHDLRSGARGDEVWDDCYARIAELSGGGRDQEAAILFGALLEGGRGVPAFLRQRSAFGLAEFRCRGFEPERARTVLESALTATQRLTPAAALLEARSLAMQSEYRRAHEVLDAAIASTDAEAFLEGVVGLVVFRAETWLSQGRLPETETALAEASRLLDRVGALPDIPISVTADLADVVSPPLPPPGPFSGLQAKLVRLRADFEFRRRRLPVALALALLSVKMEARAGNLPGLGQGLHSVGSIYMQGGQHEKAEMHFRRALSLHRDVGDLKAQADTLNNLGILKRREGKTLEAIDDLNEALRLRRDIGHRQGEVDCWLNIATIHTQRRELSAAARDFKICLKLKRKLPENNNPAVILNNLGVVAQLRDRLAAALRYYREAAATDRAFGNEAGALTWEVNEGLVLAMSGHWEEARTRLRGLIEGLTERGLAAAHGVALWGLADVESGCAAWSDAEDRLGEALELFTLQDDEASRLETLVRLFELHIRRGRYERAIWVRGAIERANLGLLAPEVGNRFAALELRLRTEARDVFPNEDPAAVERVVEALKQTQQARMPGQAFLAASALAAHHERIDRRDRAFYFYNLALEHLESVLDAIGDPRQMSAWLETPDVAEFRTRSRNFVANCMPGHEENERRRPFEVRNALSSLKRGFFDVERELETTVRNMRRNEEGVRRILEISQSLNATVSADTLFERIVDGVVDFARAERGFLIFIEDGEVRIPVARTNRREAVQNPLEQVSSQVVDQIARTRRSVLLLNAMDEDEYRARESVLKLELRSIMAVPMLRQDQLVGILYVDNRSRIGQFQAAELELLAILASQAAIAIENARLLRDFIREEKMRMLGVMAGGVAHDFNNLLAAILGRVQLVRERFEDEALLGHLGTIEKAARDGVVVARRLQNFTHVSRASDLEAVELRELVEDVREFTRVKWESEAARSGRPVAVVNRVAPDLAVRGQPSELREVLMNVLLNGISALSEGGEIVFDAEDGDEIVRLEVRLSGAGAEVDGRTLDLDPMHSTHDRADGFGMSVAHGILMRHGGRAFVRADEDGSGHTVVIELVRAEPSRAPVPARPAPTPERPAPRAGSRILVVDDEEGIRSLLDELLAGEGYEVVPTASGPEALDAFDAAPFDLVITDLGMVPMSGWDLAREIKRRDGGVGVILLTGWAEDIPEDRARAHRVDRVVSKPFDVAQLLDIVAGAVR